MRVHNCKIFPYPMISKPFLRTNSFMEIVRRNFVVQNSEGQTNRQTKTQRFDRPDGGQNLSPNNLGMVTEDLEHGLAPWNRLGV